jgi:hypothetical protein
MEMEKYYNLRTLSNNLGLQKPSRSRDNLSLGLLAEPHSQQIRAANTKI